MIKNVKIENFKNISADLQGLKKLNVIIGPNNSGKTNLLKALTIMTDVVKEKSTNEIFSNVINSIGGYYTVNKNFPNDSVKIHYDIETYFGRDRKNVSYKIEYMYDKNDSHPNIVKEQYYYTERDKKNIINNNNNPFYIFNCHEQFQGHGLFTYFEEEIQKMSGKVVSISKNESVINQITRSGQILNFMKFKNGIDKVVHLKNYFINSRFISMTKTTYDYSKSTLNNRNLNLEVLKDDGSNLLDCVYRIYCTEKSVKKNNFEKLLCRIFNCDDVTIEFKKFEDSIYPHINIKNDNKIEEKSFGELSDGTLKLMFLAVLIVDSSIGNDEYGLIAIDEPETNLHPAWVNEFGKWIVESDLNNQVFISTHSPELLDALTDGFIKGDIAVIILQPNGYIENLDYEYVENVINSGYGLGDLYRTSNEYLGGWPWEK